MIFQLEEDIVFPDPRLGEEDGLLAVGGDLSEERLLLAYSYGIFPWFSFRDWSQPAWYCPLQRFVIFPDEIHISHSMRTLMNKKTYRVTFNRDFDGVIAGCSQVNGRYDQQGAWLGEEIMKAYRHLNRQGYATSVEVWNSDGELAGGLYGVVMGDCFIGESMFSREPNTSKLALIHLAKFMQRIGGKLIDCQLETPHLKSMGGRFISYEEYLEILNPGALAALDCPSRGES
ncbi:MAG: leucyl/phenylalanyl-tRNA--protein transferase [Muribaculaceae bacterium]|nr:leucyl/phenylalanyl-tRNA--protein transferase [Muribaculaceae bacterium]